MGIPAVDPAPNARIENARVRALERRARLRARLRPLGWALIAVVIAGTLESRPAPGTHGRSAVILAAVAVWTLAMASMLDDRWLGDNLRAEAVAIAAMGAAGVLLSGLQTHGATEIAGSVAVWLAVARLPGPLGVALAAAITIGLAVAAALAGSDAAGVAASLLLCVLLGVMAAFMRQARESQDRTERLLAELEAARDEQARTAAIRERGRIAAELHDVLAHSLSGAAIQLQGARMLADRDGASDGVQSAIERASELVRNGLAEARQAVGTLRGERLPGVDDVAAMIEGVGRDSGLDVRFQTDGEARAVAAEAGLALYRAAQEALTNVSRYAPGARVVVCLGYDSDRVRLVVDDHRSPGTSVPAGLSGAGGGYGLAGMRERLERAGGSLRAGPTEDGWRVEAEVPA